MSAQALTPAQAARLIRVVRRDGSMGLMTWAALGGRFEQRGLVRTVQHRDHTRSYALTDAGIAAIEAARSANPCPGCVKQGDATGCRPGLVFVGWGRGWEPCPRCNGTGIDEGDVAKEA